MSEPQSAVPAESPTGPVLQVERVDKTFKRGAVPVQALVGVDFTVQRGELVAVMGASGSGKSTLLHVIAGLTRPDAGRVLVEGEDVSGFNEARATAFRRQRIGLVFQAFNLIPALSLEENVMLPLVADGRRAEALQRVGPLLEQLGLSDRRAHLPDKLSGGEQQRAAIARALITEPATILADEPTGNLDSVAGQAFCKLLAGLCSEQGRTAVVVTHEPAVAIWAQRVVILKDGRNLTEIATADLDGAEQLAARYQEVVNAEPAVAGGAV